MKAEFVERIYAGWLAKIIGIRLGADVEGWTYDKIKNVFGELTDYPVDYKTFAADDDSNGPLFFLRALEDCGKGEDMTAQDVGEALLNYAPFEHGFFWWGGYGISTEHTAYLNLRNGIKAPQSGSIAQNGSTTAEQIGGQIFIDTWGLVNPGNPDRAAKMAEKAASVTHGGNGIYGGIFVATAIAYAFVEKDIKKIIEKALTYIPADCEYTRVVRAVMAYHEQNPGNWRDCYQYIFENFGYDKYPGNCHIIPNSAVMILGLLYGNGDFSDTLNITNMCGWDTDCNVGNIATIMGVVCGLEGIDYDKWRKPVDDVLICSTAVGSLSTMDIPYGAIYIAKLACALNGEELPAPYNTILEKKIDDCHFEFPGSTHHILMRGDQDDFKYHKVNSDEAARSGNRSLKLTFMSKRINKKKPNIYIYRKTYYYMDDFSDYRYSPEFSSIVYPGMTMHASIMVPDYGCPEDFFKFLCVRPYVRDSHTGNIITGEQTILKNNEWADLVFKIPAMDGALLDEMGLQIVPALGQIECGKHQNFVFFLDDLYADGEPDYSIDFSKESKYALDSITQMTKNKGLMYLQDGKFHLSCADFAEAYTGRHDWKDYTATFYMTPITGEQHYCQVRVQGCIRSYAAALMPGGKLAIVKNAFGYSTLAETDFAWELGKTYDIRVTAKGNVITASVDGATVTAVDNDRPYLEGMVGIGNEHGSHSCCSSIEVRG